MRIAPPAKDEKATAPPPVAADDLDAIRQAQALSLFNWEPKTHTLATADAAATPSVPTLEVHDTVRVPLNRPELRLAPRTEPSQPPVVEQPFRKRRMLVALLLVFAVAQAALIAVWMFRGSVIAGAPETGTVVLTSDPSGSSVTIDGASRGATPLTVTLAAGTHRIEIGSGAQARTQEITVGRGGHASVHVAFAPVAAAAASGTGTGGLQVTTEPPGARVSIDGESRGVSPITVSNLPPGNHVVTLRRGSGASTTRTVTIHEGAVASLVISLAEPGAFASGWLAVTSRVPLQIWEGSTLMGTSEAPRVLLPAGAHELVLVNAELGVRLARSVRVVAAQTSTIEITLPMGSVSVNALPWAEVWIDGNRAGDTPIGNIPVTLGRHELLFRHPEFGEQRRMVTVGMTTPQRVSVNMRTP